MQGGSLRHFRIIAAFAVLAFVLAACGGDDADTATTAAPTTIATTTTEATTTTVPATTTTEVPFEAPDGALVSYHAMAAPTLDGVIDDAWAEADAITVDVGGGANSGSADVSLKSMYAEDMVYFLVSWDDPTESYLRSPWEKQADGTWAQRSDPDDKGGDNNVWYEDKMSVIWNIGNSIANFESAGCFAACHAGENSDVKPYGNKYTAAEGELGDIWHWKSVRNLNQVDDQYLDSTQWSAETPSAGRHGDPKDGGGYINNKTEDGSQPLFMSPDGGSKDGAPGYILDSEKVDFDDSLFEAGDLVAGIYKAQFTGDRGDLSAGWVYADGVWTVEIGRKLVTGSEYDVQFDDLAGTYNFGVATFDNAQVRHSFQTGVGVFVFKP
jgi:hypothetical protein